MARQTKSQKIRVLLTQGKTVKEIAKAVKCHPGLVYQVRSYDKRKAEKAKKPASKKTVAKKDWVLVTTSRSNEPIGIPRDVYEAHQPKDYPMPKRNIVQRFFNWLCGG